MDFSVLEKVGLTKNEIKVYLALLENGESTSGPLIKLAGINSSKVYESLERLEKKGIVSYVKKTNKKYFKATRPERLLDFLEDKKKNIEQEKEEISKILPELSSLSKKSDEEEQEATIYQGIKGYRTLLENMLSELKFGGNYLAFASGMLKQVLGDYWYVFQDKKKKYKIKARCLWDGRIRKQKDYIREYVGKGKFIEKGVYLSPVDVWVYNDNIIQVSYSTKPLFAVLIKSKGLAQSYREIFETIWKNSKGRV